MELARANAKNLLKKLGVSNISGIDIEDICFSENLFVKTKKELPSEGRIVFQNDIGIISIRSDVTDFCHRRFIIGHEMGHFYNESNIIVKDQIFYNCTGENFYGYRSTNKNDNERNASLFASELLMPEEIFRECCINTKLSRELLNKICSEFNVSLTAALIRLTYLNIFNFAVIMVTNKKVKWSAISQNFRYKFIPAGMPVSELSYSYDFFNGEPIPECNDVPAEAWFSKDYTFTNKNDRIMEMVIPMPRYNSAMVVVCNRIWD